MKIQKFRAKRTFRSLILGKHQSEANNFWQDAKQGSYLSMIFEVYTQVLLLSKISENL